MWLAAAGSANIGPFAYYLTGDSNLDGTLDVRDFNTWNANKFTAKAARCSGDFNADGNVDVSDDNIWSRNKFQTVMPPARVANELFSIEIYGLDTVNEARSHFPIDPFALPTHEQQPLRYNRRICRSYQAHREILHPLRLRRVDCMSGPENANKSAPIAKPHYDLGA